MKLLSHLTHLTVSQNWINIIIPSLKTIKLPQLFFPLKLLNLFIYKTQTLTHPLNLNNDSSSPHSPPHSHFLTPPPRRKIPSSGQPNLPIRQHRGIWRPHYRVRRWLPRHPQRRLHLLHLPLPPLLLQHHS